MDYGHEQTDRELKRLEKRITEEYEKAYKEVKKKADDYFAQFQKADADKKKLVDAGLMSKKDYLAWRQSAMLSSKRWNDMANVLAQDLVNADKIAASMIGEHLPDVYALNANYGAYEIEHGLEIDTSWTMYDHSTVENLMRDDPQMIPKPRMDIPKDMRWNRQKITSAITQGVLQGDSIPDIAKRLRAVTSMDRTAAIRNARTYTTAAENKGRVDSYQWAKELGIELQKEWMSTPDGRTRDSHVDLDGERVDVDATFSNGCRYPADPMGDPAEVYNCRCTLVAAVKGRQYHDSRFTRLPEGMTYEDWKAHKLREENSGESSGEHVVVNGEDISATWVRRENKFAFEIEDVINAQGFDGLPKVVSSEEFDKIAQNTEAICKRGYNVSYETLKEDAQDVLERYHEELIKGKWYVDCHVGGADYGQGMYSYVKHGDVTKTLTMDEAVKFYAGDNGRTEVFTFDKSTKIIKSSEIKELKKQEELIVKERTSEVFDKLNAEEKDIAERMVGIKPTWGKEGQKAIEKFGELSEERQTMIQSVATDYRGIVQKEIERYRKMDDGAYAALKGYDAIEADYSLGDNTHELIILNRTKLIFRGK